MKSDNGPLWDFCKANGLSFHLSCPHTSPQNRKVERQIRTINNILCTLLARASLPHSFWHHALQMATYLLNILPHKLLNYQSHLRIILSASSDELRQSIIFLLSSEFAIKDLGPLSYFLGILVTRHTSGLCFSQKKYVVEIIDCVGMSPCKPSPTLVDTKMKLCGTMSKQIEDPSLYKRLVGTLHYLIFTRPDIAYVVQKVCLFMQDPREKHMHVLKHILCYIQGTMDFDLHLCPSSTSTLISYTEVDWGGCPDTLRSTSGYCVFG